MSDILKRCTRCGQSRSIECFHKEKLGKFGVRSKCKPCLIEANLISATGKTYILNQELARSRRRRWEDKNPEWRKEYASRYQRENRDAINKRRRNSYANSEDYKAYVIAYVHKRRDSKIGNFSSLEWLELLRFYDYRCLVPNCLSEDVTVDHVIPISKGGLNTIENLQPLCRHHNAVKGTDIVDYR